MNILLIGDIVGKPGRKVIKRLLPHIKSQYNVEFVVANGENGAGGFGLTIDTAKELFNSGIDVLTSGNHIWDKKDIFVELEEGNRILRPLNYPEGVPGKGYTILETETGKRVCVINIQGRIFMPPIDCPFMGIQKLLDSISQDVKTIIVDFHAEATSEKMAMGIFLDGKVSVVAGTHTHVQTADERILPNGTGYITDLGMTGPHDSVIGMEFEKSMKRILYQIPFKLNVAKKNLRLNGIFLNVDDETGKCKEIKRLDIPYEV